MALVCGRGLLPMYNRLNGQNISDYLRDIRRVMALPPPAIQHHQQQRLRKVVASALGTPWYGRTLREAGIRSSEDVSLENLDHLPLIDKQDLRAHGEAFRNPSVRDDGVVHTATGGTTDSPLRLMVDKQSYLRRWGATTYFDQATGIRPGEKSVRLWGAPQDFPARPSMLQKIKSALINRILFLPSSPLDDSLLEAHVNSIQKYRPRHMTSYPTPLGILAEYMLRKGVFIPFKTVSCCAEPLMSHNRAVIEQAFGVKVFDWYGAREAGRIATECHRHNGMHVNAYGLIVEVLPVSGHELGEIVLTDLYNVAMPMIRYRIGDLAQLSHVPCPCGCPTPRLFDIAGRTVDCFINVKGQLISGIAFTNRFIRDNQLVEKLQIIQRGYSDFEILAVPGPKFNESTLGEFRARLDEFMMQPNEVTMRVVEDIPPARSGKTVFCKRLFNPDANTAKGGLAASAVAPSAEVEP